MTLAELKLLLPDNILSTLSTEDGDTLLETLIARAQNLATEVGIVRSNIKGEFTLHYVLGFLYERNGLLEIAREHQRYLEALIQNVENTRNRTVHNIATWSKDKIVDETDPRNWWWNI